MMRQRNTEPLRFRTEGEKKSSGYLRPAIVSGFKHRELTPKNFSMKFVACLQTVPVTVKRTINNCLNRFSIGQSNMTRRGNEGF